MKAAIREALHVVALLLGPPLVFAGCLAALVLFLGIVQVIGPIVFFGGLSWVSWRMLTRSPAQRAAHRRAIDAEKARMHVLIHSHMAAHRLVDTPQNRWHVLQLLSRPGSRRGRR